jgi:hypothetical protein
MDKMKWIEMSERKETTTTIIIRYLLFLDGSLMQVKFIKKYLRGGKCVWGYKIQHLRDIREWENSICPDNVFVV